ncbi:sensor domain-containing diguanylate cyclase [Parendozoicomonas haliclonae]|uniref:diguanylate cyclase n=2 Tax=Parendozoicomonas haliclonae TaxID=1960125 RepID=A0A1X7APJ8_9GAMM|nr:Phytochrome-like protein cph2 [Parendozoicomonas haliclonae]
MDGFQFVETRIGEMAARYDYSLSPAIVAFMDGLRDDRAGTLSRAAEHFLICTRLCTGEEKRLGLHAHIMLGAIYGELGDNFKAYHHFSQVLEHSSELDPAPLASLYVNLSHLFLGLRRYEDVVRFGRQAITISTELQSHYGLVIGLINTGLALAHLGNTEEGYIMVKRALTAAETHQLDRFLGLTHSYNAMVLAMHRPDQIHQTEFHYQKAVELMASMTSNYDSLDNLLRYADFLLKNNRASEVKDMWDDLNRLVVGFGSVELDHRLIKIEIALLRRENQSRLLLEALDRYLASLECEYDASCKREGDLLIRQVSKLEEYQADLISMQVHNNLDAITEIGQLISTADNLGSVMTKVLDKVGLIFPTHEFGIGLYDASTQELDYRYFITRDGFMPAITVQCDKVVNFGSYVINTGQTVHLSNVSAEVMQGYYRKFADLQQSPFHYEAKNFGPQETQSMLLTPVRLGNEVLGILSVQAIEQDQYQQHHRQLFERLASLIAIALKNLRQKEELQKNYARLEHVSRTDPLTQLFNRHHLKTVVRQVVNTAASDQQPVTVILIDIDYYKGYNDHLGHYAGDQALVAVANTIKVTFGDEGDYVFRYGGDELLVISKGSKLTHVRRKLKSLKSTIKALNLVHPLSQCSDRVTLSVGATYCSEIHNDTALFNQAFEEADQRLYQVKDQGRNGFMIGSLGDAPIVRAFDGHVAV